MISHGNKKMQILINKPFCLCLSITGISGILMYKFWYDYVKPKYREKANLCHMDTKAL